MKHAFKALIDYFSIHAQSESNLIDFLEQFFEISAQHDLRLSATKTVFYTKKVKWSERIINSNGYRLDPRNLKATRQMEVPKLASELCQILQCCGWMSRCIPDF